MKIDILTKSLFESHMKDMKIIFSDIRKEITYLRKDLKILENRVLILENKEEIKDDTKGN